jgi:phosphatidate phosphatase APP1
LIAPPAAGTAVTVTIGERQHTMTAERGGYVHAELPAVLLPGWHDVIVAVDDREPVACRVRAVDPLGSRGVVSDIDDTILVTWVPRPLLAAWNTFFVREKARRPVPGMGELLRALVGDDGFVAYVSTGAWNFAPHLERFMTEHGLPPGPLLLTDWGPTQSGWFRSGAAHKRDMLERLRREHPSVRWALVGDDGQRDPQIYADFAAAHPNATRAVAIRQLSVAQRVLAGGTPTPTSTPHTTVQAGETETSPATRAPGPPWVSGSDGYELMAALRAAGILPPESNRDDAGAPTASTD